jgi:D-alanine-D-alanine ligase
MEAASMTTDGRTDGRVTRPLDITVLMGGPSREHDVSILSGSAVADALERNGHAVTRMDIRPTDLSALDREGLELVFIALHGQFGESGEVQALCEQRGLPYVGSGPRASQLAIDKAASKQAFRRAGLRTPDWMIIERYHAPEVYGRWLEELPLPVVVKPVDDGSSVGVTIARTVEQRDAALDELLDDYGRALIEAFVPGRELTVGILGESALPVLEVRPKRAFYDYLAKYADEAGTEYSFELDLPEDLLAGIQHDALRAHRSLGCRHLSRVDFILDDDRDAHILEINTIPGFTAHSLLPKAAARVGMDFDRLVQRLVDLAMDNRCQSGQGG